MHALSFLVAVPLLAIFHGLLFSTQYVLPFEIWDLARCARIAMVTQFVVLLFRFVLVVRSKMVHYSKRAAKLPSLPPEGHVDKFVVPMAEEIVKFCVICLFSNGRALSATHVYVVALVYALNKLVCILFTFSPLHHSVHYNKFNKLHQIWQDGESLPASKIPSFGIDQESGWKSRLSVDSSDSGATLNNVPEPAETPVFNLNSFSTSLAKAKLMPILGSDRIQTHHDVIDRLYSVSPKNTLHLQEADSDSDDDVTLYIISGESDSADSASLHTNGTHLGGGGGGNFKYKFPDGSKLRFGGGAGFDYQHDTPETDPPRDGSCSESSSSSTVTSNSFGEREKEWLRPFLLWFRWLIPIHGDRMPTDINTNQSIQKKLSTYTMNSEVLSLKSKDSRNYGTFDLESQDFKARNKNVHTFYRFARFANKYFDYWSPNFSDLIRDIDPAFMRFGVTLPDFPTFFFLIFEVSICLWQFASSLLLAYPILAQEVHIWNFMACVALMVVCKLFCCNYLHFQSTVSYKVALVLELFVNLSMFCSCLYYYSHL